MYKYHFCADVENVIKDQITWNEHSVNVTGRRFFDNVVLTDRQRRVPVERCATRLSRTTVWSSVFLWEASRT